MAAHNLRSKSSDAVLRAGQAPKQSKDNLGPLSNLVGTWMGTGWNLIALPDKSREKPFLLLREPIIETLTFAPLGGAVPNRGDTETQLIFGVQYEQRISNAVDNKPLHVENGMWLLLDGQEGLIARQSTIPHGNALLALGKASTEERPPTIKPINPLPFRLGMQQPRVEDPQNDYTAPYFEHVAGFNTLNPNEILQKKIEDQQIVRTTTLVVSAKRTDDGVKNIPFLVKNAKATSLESTFWIETIYDQEMDAEFQQLQYSQSVDLDFPSSTDLSENKEMIVWPHISVATLIKQ